MIIDYFKKRPEKFAISNVIVAELLINGWISRFGNANVTSIKECLEHALMCLQSNDMMERFDGTLKNNLKVYMNNHCN